MIKKNISKIPSFDEIPRNINGKVFLMSLNYYNKGQRALIDRTGIVGLCWHDLPRETTSRFFEDGLSATEVQSITGHRALQMFSTYTTHNV